MGNHEHQEGSSGGAEGVGRGTEQVKTDEVNPDHLRDTFVGTFVAGLFVGAFRRQGESTLVDTLVGTLLVGQVSLSSALCVAQRI